MIPVSPVPYENAIRLSTQTIMDCIRQIAEGKHPEYDDNCRREIRECLRSIVHFRSRQRELDPVYRCQVGDRSDMSDLNLIRGCADSRKSWYPGSKPLAHRFEHTRSQRSRETVPPYKVSPSQHLFHYQWMISAPDAFVLRTSESTECSYPIGMSYPAA